VPIRETEAEWETRIDLWDAVRQLPRKQQEAVILHYMLDLPVGSVADLMNCRDGTVKSHLSRARFALRRSIENDSTWGRQTSSSSDIGG
jgi:RNA polymerase sigma-70 factor (ECF subfamily)